MATAISHSRVEAYLSCRRKDWYGYQFPTDIGRGIRRQQTSDSLGMGTAFHRIAAVYYTVFLNGGEREEAQEYAWGEYERIIEEGFEEAGGQKATLETVVHRWIDNETLSEDYEILGVEQEFNLQSDEGEFPFIVDLLVRDRRTGLVYVVDHKTGYYLYRPEYTDLMPQVPKYIGALRALGYNIAGGLYQVVRTQALQGKKMLKPELIMTVGEALGISDDEQAMKILSKNTVANLEAICDEKGIEHCTPPDPEQVLQILPLDPSLDRVLETVREQFEVAQEIRERDEWPEEDQDRRAYRTANQTVCKSCNFRLICAEELRGGNTGLVLLAEYEAKPKRDAIEVSEEVDDEV